MKVKFLLFFACLCSFMGAWAQDFGLSLNISTANQATINYDAASGIYTITTTGEDPFVSINALTSALPDDQCVLTFDYQCAPATTGGLQIFFSPTYSEARSIKCADLANTSEWTTFSKEMKNTISNLGWGAAKSVMRIDWGGRSGVTIKVKNLRFREMNDEEKKNYDITGNKDAMMKFKAARLQNYLYNNVYASAVSHVSVSVDKVTISGKCVGNEDFALVEAMPNIDITECKKFAHRTSVNLSLIHI